LLRSEENKIDCVIEVCGSADVVPNGIRLLKPGGLYLFVGMVHPQTEFKLIGEQVIRKCLTIKGIHNYEAKHLERAVEFLHKTLNKYPFQKLVSPYAFPLADLPLAIEDAKSRKYQRICIKP
jgi:threonine dehydrogenase-like Zn-dependent dehydrogenase